MMKYFDTHCHLNIKPFSDDEKNILKYIKESNVMMNIVGVDLESSLKAIKLSDGIKTFASIGIHPNDLISNQQIDIDIEKIESEIIKNKSKIIGIGETGFDFYKSNKKEKYELQAYSLKKHIKLAEKYNLPIILHVRDANSEMIEFIKEYKPKCKILIHCFSGDINHVKEYIKLDVYFSISGTITFKNSLELVEAVKEIPNNKLLAETDSPFLSPEPYRGKINHPINVMIIIDKINEIKNSNLSKDIFNNSLSFFSIKNKI